MLSPESNRRTDNTENFIKNKMDNSIKSNALIKSEQSLNSVKIFKSNKSLRIDREEETSKIVFWAQRIQEKVQVKVS